MARHVPILEFLHELRSAGIEVEYAELLTRPQDYWERLPSGRRDLLFARMNMEIPGETPMDAVVVKRRARALAAENVFVRLDERANPARMPFGRARDILLYRPLEVPTRADGTAMDTTESTAPKTETFRPGAGPTAGPRRVLALLDDIWGDPYDLQTEGNFYRNETELDHVEIMRYEVEPAFASVGVIYAPDGRSVYQVEEPRLTELELALAATLNERVRDALVLADCEEEERPAHLARTLFDLMRAYRFRVDRRTAYKLGYYFVRNYIGFGRLDPLLRDSHIEDISCNGPALPVYVVHSRHQNLATNLVFDELELNSFTIKLAQRGGKLLSVAQPLVDATLPDGSRIQASLGREVTSRGSAFTIRKFREDPLTAVDLIRTGSHTLDTMAFLWFIVEMKRSLVVMGSTASGKTTTLNCLSQFIPPTLKVVTIEDTREITLQHENWLAAVTRESFTGGESERISMYDLLRAALRQRPEYIIVGEIRGEEGLTLFQAMSTGHTCFSTMHAGSVENAVHRLENAPIGVPRVMLTSLDLFLLQGQVDVDGKPKRRMLSLVELNGVDQSTRNLRMNEIFHWEPSGDRFDAANPSYILEQARAKRGWSRGELDEDLARRREVLGGLVERKERDYRQVAKAVREFYAERTGAPEASS